MRRAEEAVERAKRAEFVLTLHSGSSVDFWPVGGHRGPGAVSAFWIYVHNRDAKAEHVTVRIYLPAWVH